MIKMPNPIKNILLTGCLLLAAGCTTIKQSDPPRTAEEEMLISSAADRAAVQLSLEIPKGTKAFIDTTNFEGTDSKYAIGAIRGELLEKGVVLADDKKSADIIVEIRSGALSTDNKEVFVGIPSFTVPIPFASTGLSTPELALYKSADQKGVAKFAANAYDGSKHIYEIPAQDLEYGFSHDTKYTVLLFISWEDNDSAPDEDSGPSLTEQKTTGSGQ